jgi:methanogenic corrinoid protein MtbC1
MSQEIVVERLYTALIAGDRPTSRRVLEESLSEGVPPSRVLCDICWPAHEMMERLYKHDQLSQMNYHMGTRLLRMLTDQLTASLDRVERNGKSIFAVSGPSQGEELGGQMACDMLEAAGFEVNFTGGGIPADEIIAHVQSSQPDILVLFSSAAADLPGVRRIVDALKANGSASGTQIVVGGGVFNRAEGLAEEMGIELSAASPLELVELLCEPRVASVVTPQLGRLKAEKQMKAGRKKVA